MTHKLPPIGAVAVRIQPLSPRHRLAHLRALIRQQPAGSARRDQLVALLRDELAGKTGHENRAT